ncbi:MAG: hypothetical protein K1Y02_23385 [Candidatus Hydrogenedentes bacterium]|nr:hypothetical protein [Candidatus Hydrogenedentota bacterium]
MVLKVVASSFQFGLVLLAAACVMLAGCGEKKDDAAASEPVAVEGSSGAENAAPADPSAAEQVREFGLQRSEKRKRDREEADALEQNR